MKQSRWIEDSKYTLKQRYAVELTGAPAGDEPDPQLHQRARPPKKPARKPSGER